MDAEKVAEVEMKELTPGEDNKDAEKGKMEGTKETEKKSEEAEAKKLFRSKKNVYSKLKNSTENIYSLSVPVSTPKPDEGQEKEEEKEKGKENAQKEEKAEGGNVYSILKNPPGNVYMTGMTSSTPQHAGQEKEEKAHGDEGEETNVYCKLNTPSENIYMSATSSTPKHNKDVYRKVRLYKWIAAVFIILSLLLLAVVLALAMKLQEFQSIQKCPDKQLSVEVQETRSQPSNPGYQCIECGKGWLKYKNSCYYISKDRLSWQESRGKCQQMGGDLVIIDNENVQKFLTKNLGMMYWIGLHYSEKQQWMWIDNTALTQSGSYWDNDQPKPDLQGSCALLKGRTSQLNNWLTTSCVQVSNYICQKG